MKLQSAPGACPSINVAGFEYGPAEDGTVDIERPDHIALAIEHGFTEVGAAPAPTATTQ